MADINDAIGSAVGITLVGVAGAFAIRELGKANSRNYGRRRTRRRRRR